MLGAKARLQEVKEMKMQGETTSFLKFNRNQHS